MDENNQAILLLSAQFSAPGRGVPTPLTALEYGRFAAWMRQAGFQPKDLFHQVDKLLHQWRDPKGKVTAERLKYLLGRGMAMGVALEKWQSAGIWILTRADREYPRPLKRNLLEAAPAVLFGVGDKGLLNAGGLAVVGSRKIESEETEFTQAVARQAALEGLNLVSGGARGVDETAMLAALEIEGSALGVLANDLFKSALSGKWRKHLKSGQLALISPFYPEARFHVGNAMGRNKYIYCLSDYALVIRSEKEKGGTWAGAIENLKEKNQWVPLFVAAPSDADGNAALIEMGASPLHAPKPKGVVSENWLVNKLEGSTETDAPQPRPVVDSSEEPPAQENVISEPELQKSADDPEVAGVESNTEFSSQDVSGVGDTIELEPSYDEFMQYVSQKILDEGEVKFSELKDARQDLKQQKIREWLDQAVELGVLKRKGRLLTYLLNQATVDQADFFAD